LRRGLIAAAVAVLLWSGAPAQAHDGRVGAGRAGPRATPGQQVPVILSDNVQLVTTRPETLAISGVFATTGSYYYVSSIDSISVYDTKDPLNPTLVGILPNLVFENEAISYGERKVGEVIERFVLVGSDPVAIPIDPALRPAPNLGGKEVYVIDVTDPTKPHVRSQAQTSTSTHTVHCMDAGCRHAYTAGRNDKFSILDLTDLDKPAELKTVASPAAMGSFAAGHHWAIDHAGIAWHTGGGGMAAFDIRDPVNPVLLNATDKQGTSTPWNDFILHNSFRPNATAFAGSATAAPSVAAGNVVLVTEEDYFDSGEELDCAQAGSFETWYVPTLDATAFKAANPDGKQDRGTIRPLDRINPVKVGDGLSAPVGGFCSAHWFDYHQSGIVAQAYYQQGMRLIDVRDPTHLAQYGFFTSGASEVWDAYFVPERDANGVDTGRSTNVVYTADLVRGMDVLTVTLPDVGGVAAPPGAASVIPPATAASAGNGELTRSLPATGIDPWLSLAAFLVAGGIGALVLRRRRT
jgi:LPXTG-motif cell wall-anchored protein